VVNLNDYQTEAHDYAAYGDDSPLYPFLGLAGETGEVCEKLKKLIRHKGCMEFFPKGLSHTERQDLLTELGDVLWYLSEITGLLGSDLETVANMNLVKLSGRKARGTITSVDRSKEKAEDETYE
jgi:NTP pyrophosphatase (non-canonical NTP hydrolase)